MQQYGKIYQRLFKAYQQKRKQLAVLIDPDKVNQKEIERLVFNAVKAKVDFVFVGGSLVMNNKSDEWIALIKKKCTIPVVVFPGSVFQVSPNADALLFLSLISGRNPDLLIGQQVIAAPIVKQMGIEVVPTGYMLVDGGVPTTVSYISNSQPIPANKAQIAVCTAMAGEMLGLRLIYLDSGSGAKNAVPPNMIAAVRKYVNLPIVVGGGIRTPEQAQQTCQAGADLVVVGNAFESNPDLIYDMAAAVHNLVIDEQ